MHYPHRWPTRPSTSPCIGYYFLVLSAYELAGRDPYPRGQRDPTPPSRCPTAVPGAPTRTDSPGTRPWELAELQQTGQDTPSLPSEKRPSHVCGSLGGQRCLAAHYGGSLCRYACKRPLLSALLRA